MELKQGTLLKHGEYRIEKVLGQGGFGITYMAEQIGLERKVAIKEFFMKEYCNRDEATSHVSVPSVGSKELVSKFRQKFVKEAQNIASFNHNHIIRIHDVFEENNTAYYVMEYLDCGSLSDYLSRRGRLSEEESISFIRQIADALAYIHKRKVNHLDVKPGNILLDEKNNAVLIDFGLSKHYDSGGHQTSSTPVGISKGYAPIEQYKQGGVSQFSPETDIYSLGATFYKLVTGETPSEADDIYENGLKFPDGIRLSANVKDAILSAMQPRRKDRPQSIEKFLSILDGAVSDEEVEITVIDDPAPKPKPTPKPDPKPEPAPKPKSKVFLKVLGIVMIALLVGIGSYYGICSIRLNNKLRKTNAMSHVGVDLGLPSGIKWATCNVGADSPEDYGLYFAWGEIRPKGIYWRINSKTSGKSSYDRDIGGDKSLDAASANWGGSWRLPTEAECKELNNKCTWKWTTQKGVNGYKVTGPNGNSIFLPAAGYRKLSLSSAGEYGYYWSSTPYGSLSVSAYELIFGSESHYVHWYYRSYSRSVRPVSE